MIFALRRFRIRGLHGKYDVDIPIVDNKIILVGVNGLGKTTVVNILYLLVTEQWTRLLEYDFLSVTLDTNQKFHEINRQEIEELGDSREQFGRNLRAFAGMPSRHYAKLVSHPLFTELLNAALNPSRLRSVAEVIATDVEIPVSIVMRAVREIPTMKQTDLFKYPQTITNLFDDLRGDGDFSVLYLPTYRRIEQDIKAIFPDLDERQLKEFGVRAGAVTWGANRAHVELVQFGMQDVERRVEQELQTIRDSARSQLGTLTASYLRDVIRNKADKFDPQLINALDVDTVKAVLRRVEENTLDSHDKTELEAAMERIRTNQQSSSERDKYLAYFFSRLMEIYKNLSESEGSIQRLVQICNKYLEGKRLKYSDNEYTAGIVDFEDLPISWRSLSSGEKQVASLFTHLFLSKQTSQLVIIDEPELSLSVPWQKTLLPDIANSGNCALLIAVTHSPFIYANELDMYAVDLAKCITPCDANARIVQR
jgi:predicted ATP-dependent endonuclease of OLD family